MLCICTATRLDLNLPLFLSCYPTASTFVASDYRQQSAVGTYRTVGFTSLPPFFTPDFLWFGSFSSCLTGAERKRDTPLTIKVSTSQHLHAQYRTLGALKSVDPNTLSIFVFYLSLRLNM